MAHLAMLVMRVGTLGPGHWSPDPRHLRAAAVGHTARATPATPLSSPLRRRRGQ